MLVPERLLNWLQKGQSVPTQRFLPILLASILALALASPAIRTDNDIYQHTEGWLVVADISKSMTLDDVTPNRLAAMRDTALAIADHAAAMPLGLIVYAGDAFLIAPPAFDKQVFIKHVSLLEHGLIKSEGSNPTRALALASSIIDGSDILNARVFLMTDTGGIGDKTAAAITNLDKLGHRTDILLFGRGAAAAGAEWDPDAANALSRQTGSTLVAANAFGQVDLEPLQLDHKPGGGASLTPSAIDIVDWKNQSHWLLLGCIPIFLLIFLRDIQ